MTPPLQNRGSIPVDGLPRLLEASISGRVDRAHRDGLNEGYTAGTAAGAHVGATGVYLLLAAIMDQLGVDTIAVPIPTGESNPAVHVHSQIVVTAGTVVVELHRERCS